VFRISLVFAALVSLLAITTGSSARSAGTVIVRNEPWHCNRPLSQYGSLPITIRQTIVTASPAGSSDGIYLDRGCTGDGVVGTIDLIIEQAGNGSTIGPGGDAVKVRKAGNGAVPREIDITGHINCGARTTGHQDGVQATTGTDIRFWNLVSGDPDARFGTCWGAGGTFFVARGGSEFPIPRGVVCNDCRIVSAAPERGDGPGGTGLHVGQSVGSGARSSCFYKGRRGVVIEGDAEGPVNENNWWVRSASDPDRCATG
jgi:hypothetical protein